MTRILTAEAKKTAINSLNLDQIGLEISPLYMPVVNKDEGKVMYVDYCSAEESRQKHSSYEHADILEVDYIWKPGTTLHQSIPNQKFHWAVSSHVLEHIPNPLGWLNHILEVIEVDGVFSLILPDKRFCYDKFRRLTETSDVIDNWIRDV